MMNNFEHEYCVTETFEIKRSKKSTLEKIEK